MHIQTNPRRIVYDLIVLKMMPTVLSRNEIVENSLPTFNLFHQHFIVSEKTKSQPETYRFPQKYVFLKFELNHPKFLES